jgi:stearoyl-CoA desaturase (Delta-9 desaturase)
MKFSAWARRYFNAGAIPFWAIHVAAVAGVIALGWSWTGLVLALALYVARMWFVTAGYHRYFSHRAFKTSRAGQAVLAFGAQTAVQRGVIWWAAQHRRHHRHSDQPRDVHSAAREGFWYAHVGWSTAPGSDAFDHATVRDLEKYPELRWLDRHKHLPGLILLGVLALAGGWHALVWGGLVSTVLLWHGTFTINSLAHLIGKRRYATTDDSRNNWLLAVITLGEGWHNNHHHYQSSANQGFRWWEIDVTYYGLRVLGWLGLVWDVRRAPAHVVADARAALVTRS